MEKTKKTKIRDSFGDRIYNVVCFSIVLLLVFLVAYPLWFVVMAGLNTFGFFTATATSVLSKLAKYLFAAALAGVGFKIKFKDVFSKGLKPIALGGITWLCVAIASYAFGFLFAGYIGYVLNGCRKPEK